MSKVNSVEEWLVKDGVHNFSSEEDYVSPEDPLLLERLEWFQDQKLGLMMHWGPYAQLSTDASWMLCDHEAEWSRKCADWDVDAATLKQQYFDTNKTFNPIRFQPERWAELAADNGFKYLTFTTKHHDGFCMWDTKTTDYRVTGEDCPFHTHPYADICRQVFDAFRAKGLGISAYFSKADWHTPSYWAPGMLAGEVMHRGSSYNPKKYPELWEQFVQFTHQQIMELLTDYGRIEMLWLDGGWVSAQNSQDIRLGEVVDKARETQPWLLAVDRTVGGAYENIITPEQTLPEKPVHVPWESCITMSKSWGFKYEDEYKSARQLIHILIEVVAKGGNLVLNVGPQPDGRLPHIAVERILEIGAWLSVHGEAIYGTRICEPYAGEHCFFTQKEGTTYAMYLYSSETTQINQEIYLPLQHDIKQVDLIGSVEGLSFERTAEGIIVHLPAHELTEQAPIAHTFRIS
ncbi:alpha-L-fucosidase [Paenibacillus sp. FSL R10-2734]|uniref:alpha-L-fucosidase n=1 Tax=Paenibacillus sp. FSL R10-2734 TaxID=2954691 RepID=UPI0030DD71FE